MYYCEDKKNTRVRTQAHLRSMFTFFFFLNLFIKKNNNTNTNTFLAAIHTYVEV